MEVVGGLGVSPDSLPHQPSSSQFPLSLPFPHTSKMRFFRPVLQAAATVKPALREVRPLLWLPPSLLFPPFPRNPSYHPWANPTNQSSITSLSTTTTDNRHLRLQPAPQPTPSLAFTLQPSAAYHPTVATGECLSPECGDRDEAAIGYC